MRHGQNISSKSTENRIHSYRYIQGKSQSRINPINKALVIHKKQSDIESLGRCELENSSKPLHLIRSENITSLIILTSLSIKFERVIEHTCAHSVLRHTHDSSCCVEGSCSLLLRR